MNKLTIIGNLTKDPEKRTTPAGKIVCNFTVAVNSRNRDVEPEYFRVAAWGQIGEVCAQYLTKGKKVCVVGPVSLNTYDSNGQTRANMEVFANDVEFLSPKESGYTQVDTAENPFTAAEPAKAEPEKDFLEELPF